MTATDLQAMSVSMLDSVSVTDRALGWAHSATTKLIVTPNTDHFVRWRRDAVFRSLYARADLRIADGVTLPLLARASGMSVPPRVTGADLFIDCATACARTGVPLVIVGGRDGAGDQASQNLQARFPGLQVAFVAEPSVTDLFSEQYLRDLANRLAAYPEKVVALCLGSPKQERLFVDLDRRNPTIGGVFLCVGAAVDFAAGTAVRAPQLMRTLGLEWLFRLVREPGRLWRRYLLDDSAMVWFIARAALTKK